MGEKVVVTGGETADAQGERTFNVEIVALKVRARVRVRYG